MSVSKAHICAMNSPLAQTQKAGIEIIELELFGLFQPKNNLSRFKFRYLMKATYTCACNPGYVGSGMDLDASRVDDGNTAGCLPGGI